MRFEAQVRSLVEQVVERFGRLDVAVNNAGTEGPPLIVVVDDPTVTYDLPAATKVPVDFPAAPALSA